MQASENWGPRAGDGRLRAYLRPATPYSAGRKIAVCVAIPFWMLTLYSMWIQGNGHVVAWFPFVVFGIAILLAILAVKDWKHRLGIALVSLLFLYIAHQGQHNPYGSIGVFTYSASGLFWYPLRILLWNGIGGLPLFELAWPLFLFDPLFRLYLRLAWQNGFTKRGKLVTTVIGFNSPGERLRASLYVLVFTVATVILIIRVVKLVVAVMLSRAAPIDGFFLLGLLLLGFLSILQIPLLVFFVKLIIDPLRKPS